MSHSSLEDLGETSLSGLSKSLESLAVISSSLKFIPQMTLSTMTRVKILDFEGNNIEQLGPYSFNKILLQKVSDLCCFCNLELLEFLWKISREFILKVWIGESLPKFLNGTETLFNGSGLGSVNSGLVQISASLRP